MYVILLILRGFFFQSSKLIIVFTQNYWFQNVIVLDLSEQQGNVAPTAAPSAPTPAPSSTSTTSMSNNVLSDILQMTGIMTDEEEAVPSSQETISEPQKCTTTLQKGIF